MNLFLGVVVLLFFVFFYICVLCRKLLFVKSNSDALLIFCRTECLLELVMIVKDEAASISQTIDSVKGIVDRYCILDTGSSDNTVELIKRSFGSTPGHIYTEPFVDFASTRNRVLELAGTECQYTLMLSGDEYLRNGKQYPFIHRSAYPS